MYRLSENGYVLKMILFECLKFYYLMYRLSESVIMY